MKVETLTKRRVPAQRYDFPDEDIEAVLEQARSLLKARGFLTLGTHGEEFERRFAQYTGTAHAVAVNSGTGALEIILRALRVDGHDVVVPTNTFAATPFAVLRAGGRVIFADCGDDLLVDPSDVERRLTSRTKAVIVVHIGGLITPAVLALQELCRTRGIALIEDAAQAHGSRLAGRQAGTFGAAAAYSFFSTKVITTGEGGMIVTNDPEIADQARLLRDQAKVAGLNRHEHLGYNWRFTEFQAMLGLVQLARLDQFIQERQRVARVYDEVFGAATSVRPLEIPHQAAPNFYKYILFLPRIADGIAQRLSADYGVSLGGAVYDLPCHQQPVFAGIDSARLPRAEELCRRHVCPPIYPSLSDADARYVANSLLEVLA
jgi:dTDP-4-amino-4,6-dideoxygalactose transaminase